MEYYFQGTLVEYNVKQNHPRGVVLFLPYFGIHHAKKFTTGVVFLKKNS
jgi:hypothetical protein